jgi:hypothetical protein
LSAPHIVSDRSTASDDGTILRACVDELRDAVGDFSRRLAAVELELLATRHDRDEGQS